jgi:hypothetical protein
MSNDFGKSGMNTFSSLSGTDDINKLKSNYQAGHTYSFSYQEARRRADELMKTK